MRTRIMLTVTLAVAGSALLVTSALAGSTAAKAGGTLRVNHTLSDYEYIDPQKCYDTGCSEILWPTMYNLMQYPEKGGPEGKRVYPEASAAPVISKDGKTYTFAIKPGHRASNGKTVTPQWFVHAFERLLSPKMGDAASARFGAVSILGPELQGAQEFYDGKADKISGLQVQGNKLIVKLKRPFPSFLTMLAMSWFTATDPAMPYSEQDAVAPVAAAGPYHITSREVGRTVVIDRNANYKGEWPRNLDRIVITVNGDENQSVLEIKAGQADYDPVVASTAAGPLGEEFGVNKGRFFAKPTSATTYWALASLPGLPFNDVNLRKAVNWAIDRPAQVRVAGKYGGRRTNQILSPALPGFKRADNLYAYKGANIEKAKQVAGNVSRLPEIRILHRTSAADVNRGQIMRYNLEQMGLKAKTEAVPFAQILARNGDKKAGNYDMVRLGWQADYPDPSNFINVLLDGRQIPEEGSSNNSAYFNSPKFNKLMDEAAKLSGDPRFTAYGNLDIQIMQEGAPWAPIMNPNNRFFVSARVTNVIYNEANTNVALHAIILK